MIATMSIIQALLNVIIANDSNIKGYMNYGAQNNIEDVGILMDALK